jgi:hypothetical protein
MKKRVNESLGGGMLDYMIRKAISICRRLSIKILGCYKNTINSYGDEDWN